MKDWAAVAVEFAIAWALGFLLVACALWATGCVTRTTVCVETAHGVGHRDTYGGRPDSVGASVCAEIERP